MNILFDIPLFCPIIYWGIAFIMSTYQGIRGIFIQKHIVTVENTRLKAEQPPMEPWTFKEQIIVHRIHDFIFNFVCSIAGYIALYAICRIFLSINDLSKIETGTGIVLTLLTIVSLAGISGVLPPLLLLGKLFGKTR